MDKKRLDEILLNINELHSEIWKWWPEYAQLNEIKYYDEIDQITEINDNYIELSGYEPNGGERANYTMPLEYIYSLEFRKRYKAEMLEAKKKREAEKILYEAKKLTKKKLKLTKETIEKLYLKANEAKSTDELSEVDTQFNLITTNLLVEE